MHTYILHKSTQKYFSYYKQINLMVILVVCKKHSIAFLPVKISYKVMLDWDLYHIQSETIRNKGSKLKFNLVTNLVLIFFLPGINCVSWASYLTYFFFNSFISKRKVLNFVQQELNYILQ